MKTADGTALRHRPGDRQRRAPTTATPAATCCPARSTSPCSTARPARRWRPPTTSRRAARCRSWGDCYGNRVDRFLAGTAYLDGQRPVDHHGPRLLHPRRRRGLGLPQRHADPALDVRLQRLRQQRLRRPGQPPAVRRRRRRRRQATRSSTAPPRSTTTAAGLWNTRHRPRRRPARRRPDPEPARPGGTSRSTRTRSQPELVDGRRPHRPDPVDARRPPATTAVASPTTSGPAAPAPSRGRRRTRSCATPRAQTVGRKPGSTNFLAWWDGDPVARAARRHAHRQVRHRRRHPPADRRRRALEQRHQVHPGAVRRPARRLARGGHLGDDRQHRAADLRDADRRPAPRVCDPDARPEVPGRDRLAEHGLQPAAAPGFFLGTPFTLPAQPKISTP